MQNSRVPAWDGELNAADLGGRECRDGGTTLPGRVYRSGRSDQTIAALASRLREYPIDACAAHS
jgi:hypothetical protein